MGEPSFTLYAQRVGDAAAARHEHNRLLKQSHYSVLLVDVGHHVEATHVALDNSDGRLLQHVLDVWQIPMYRCPMYS